MNKLTLISVSIVLLTNLIYSQSVEIKDTSDETLMIVNDEGTDMSSITIPESNAVPIDALDKLYNDGGELNWSGNRLATGTSALWNLGAENLIYYIEGDVGMGTSIPKANLHVEGLEGVLFTGTYNGGTIPIEGAGTRMMWYPKKGAFRVGTANGTQWDDANIGTSSMGLGDDTKASGNQSVAIGVNTTASGPFSTAMGVTTFAIGDRSTSMGYYTTASGNTATAMGINTLASGDFSTSTGFYTMANSYASTAFGQYNVGGGSSTSWVGVDPLFEIGIGTGESNKKNAMTVLKNGNVGIGTTNPSSKLSVGGDGHSNYAIFGTSAGPGHNGIVGSVTSGEQAAGVSGNANYTGDVENMGGYFYSAGDRGHGVLGWANGSTGRGVYGIGGHFDGANYGVYGETYSSNGFAGYFTGGKSYFGGNVGIGTENPTYKLDVDGGNILVRGDDGYIVPGHTGTVYLGSVHSYIKAEYGYGVKIGAYAAADAINIKELSGDVGIGTTTPLGKLDVNGSIFQRGSQLYADFVFEDDYELESIQEHSDFMWTNKHLKAIPKAQVDGNGLEIIEVGSHRKGIVEELEKAHIYITQLEQKIRDQGCSLEDLTKRIESLESN